MGLFSDGEAQPHAQSDGGIHYATLGLECLDAPPNLHREQSSRWKGANAIDIATPSSNVSDPSNNSRITLDIDYFRITGKGITRVLTMFLHLHRSLYRIFL